MAEYEEKFIVVNRKHINEMITKNPETSQGIYMLYKALQQLKEHLPNHKYYVVNQDEPYADKIWEMISEGEDKKQGE